jgi:hypothetical protein
MGNASANVSAMQTPLISKVPFSPSKGPPAAATQLVAVLMFG